MEMELISRETIKPSSPTPVHLRIYPLSIIDHIVSPNSVPLLYFYNANENVCDQESKILILKKSLSQVLSRYHPLAGRFKDKSSIDCNDEGVSLLVTRIKSKLSSVLQNPIEALLNPLFPDNLQWKDMGSNASLVAIQINCFTCGGIVIGVCMSHKVGDGSTLFHFVNDWAKLNCEEGESVTFPVLASSIFPQGDIPPFPEFVFVKENTVCRRFVFEASKIESLKAMVSSHKVQNPTRVEVVTAIIYKCAVSALGLTAGNTSFRVTTNLRKRMVPPLPDKSIGNFVWVPSVSNQFMDKRKVELHEVISKTREELSEFYDKNAKHFGDLAFFSEFLKQAISIRNKNETSSTSGSPVLEKKASIFFACWCRFPIYEADFGWGKPIWVTTTGCHANNSIVLMDTSDGNGIEALVNMEEHDMVKFERDVELLQYASLNPTVGLENGH